MVKIRTKGLLARSTILGKISVLVIVLCAIIMVYSSHRLYIGLEDYRQSKELNTIQQIMDPFTAATKNFLFERGRMNVVLSDSDPISLDNSSFIHERRNASDENFKAGFSLMEKKYPDAEEVLRKEYEKIMVLRLSMDEQAQKPIQERDPYARTLWFTSCTNYINLVTSKLKNIGESDYNNSLISNYTGLIIETLRFRSIVGNESSMLTASVTGSKMLTAEEYTTLQLLRGESKQVWSDIENKIALIESENLNAAMEIVRDTYYGQFRPNQDKLLKLLINGDVYEGADKEIAKSSVPALDSILLLAEEALKGIQIENQKNMVNGYVSLASGILQVIAGLLIIIFIPTYLKRRLIQPLNKIVESVETLACGKTDILVPFVQRKDEIGKLANGVQLLQRSMGEEHALKLELKETVVKLEELSIKDHLTGIYNRRYVMERINELEKGYNRNKSAFSIIICDIDHFKIFNDHYGHDCGDMILLNAVKLMKYCCREQDILARWGGEEFLILLPDTGQEGAKALAERIRKELELKNFQYGDVSVKITMTFGVSEYSKALGIEGTITNSDMALLHGKNHGRNRVVVF